MSQIILQAQNGKYVISKEENGQEALYAEGNNASEALVLEIIVPDGWSDNGNTQINLKAHSGKYVTLHGETLVLDASGAIDQRLFTPYWRGVCSDALKAENGLFVSRETDGSARLMANRSVIGPWETFKFILV